MGVKNLWDIVESCKKTLPLHHLQNKRVCIDLSCWMVQLQNVNRSHCAMKEKLYLRGLFHRLRALIALNCSLIFVTDGAIPAVKISTYRKRLNLANEVAKDDTNGHKASSLRRNMGSEFSCMIKEAKTLGMALGIPCLDGIEEAEAQCALLNSESVCDGCFTSDSDVFLFGARTVYRDICLGDGGYVVCYEMTDIEKKLGLGKHSLIALALLLGSDYSHGVHGFGPELACQVVRSVGEDLFLQRAASDGVSFLKSLKTSKKQGQFPKGGGKENLPPPVPDQQKQDTGNQHNLEGNNEFLPVIDAYMKPRCHSADSDAVYRVLATYPFKRAELQQICDQFFGWPPEKTDEYILPRIAERELRKYANLRSSSSQLGLVLPLHKMPIECPISEVLKRRRVQGREYFEVSWVEFDGLKTSIVPADLVERACPEKIAEFEENRAQKKKQNCHRTRSKKSENTASTANADLKLQELLRGIEYEDNARRGHSSCRSTFALGTGGKQDSMISGTFLSEQYESEIPSKPSGFRYPDSSTLVGMDVIDLLSPRLKKPEDKASLANVDLKLQELVLEIESKDNARIEHSSCPSTSILGSCCQNDHMLSGTFLDEQCESKVTYEPTRNCHSSSPTTMEMDVIDLLSPRPEKSEDKASIHNGDLKPQELLLEFESGDKVRRGHSLCSASTSRSSGKNDSTMLSTVLDEEDESKITKEASSDVQSDPPPTGEVDMIDLLSPSPEPRARHVSKCQGNAEQVSVIDLSDSDVEMISPDHAQKARELRFFLASIREEIY